MSPVGRIVKVLLALCLASVALFSASAHAGDKGKKAKPDGAAAKAATDAGAVAAAPEGKPAPAKPSVRTVELKVTDKGYEPTPLSLTKGEPVKLIVTRTEAHTCATELVMDEYGINKPLPLNTPVEIAFTPDKSGTLKYGCAMGKMISGTFVIE